MSVLSKVRWPPLCLHGELDILTDTAQVVQEPLQLLWAMTPDHKYVIEITKPAERLVGTHACTNPQKLMIKGECSNPMATLSGSIGRQFYSHPRKF
jgi:hypothetical protein